jgi:hypothetical protein
MELLQRHALVPSPPTDRAQFAFLVREFVSCFYPGTEPTYGLRLFDEHLAGLKEGAGAYRRVWVIRDGWESVGFLVTTQRLDGSVKLGPVVIESGYRSEGHALEALGEIAAIYEAERRSYLYATYPGSNVFTRRLAYRAGWNVAGVVRGLYRDDEEVLIHRILSDEPVLASLSIHPCRHAEGRFVRKRGGSILLRANEFDSTHDIKLAGRRGALAVRATNRICFSRVAPGVGSLDADEVIRLVDGTTLVVWR